MFFASAIYDFHLLYITFHPLNNPKDNFWKQSYENIWQYHKFAFLLTVLHVDKNYETEQHNSDYNNKAHNFSEWFVIYVID